MDNAERDIYISIGLSNQLNKIHEQIWDAMMAGKHVIVTVDGELIKTFHGRALLDSQCQECKLK